MNVPFSQLMPLRSLIIVTTALVVGACASANAPTEPVVYSQSEAADSVPVRVGQMIRVDGVRLRFNAVDSDSRCPMDVVCVWQGDAVAAFTVELDCECRAAALELKVHTGLEPRSGIAYGRRVELLTLLPYPRASTPVKPDAYSAWVRLTRVE